MLSTDVPLSRRDCVRDEFALGGSGQPKRADKRGVRLSVKQRDALLFEPVPRPERPATSVRTDPPHEVLLITTRFLYDAAGHGAI